ncbi:MAG: hypothetical protein U1F56_25845 [Rubrivivax sp.]
MAWPRYGKSERGRAELQQRSADLDAATRALLILCNGRVSADELRAQCGARTDERLQRLLERGLVERLERPAPAASPAGPPSELPSDRSSELPSVPPSGLSAMPELRAAKARALVQMQRLFGPGGGAQTQQLVKARDEAEFEAALRAIHDAISVYQGRKGADALVRQIREGP